MSSKGGNPNWRKGVSGNPGGRVKIDMRIKELAKQKTELALNTLAHICGKGESESARVSAAVALLDRGWGKPAQAVDLTNSDGSLASAWAAARAGMEQDGDAEGSHVEH